MPLVTISIEPHPISKPGPDLRFAHMYNNIISNDQFPSRHPHPRVNKYIFRDLKNYCFWNTLIFLIFYFQSVHTYNIKWSISLSSSSFYKVQIQFYNRHRLGPQHFPQNFDDPGLLYGSGSSHKYQILNSLKILMTQVYNMILIILCTVQAVKARKIPENFNEAK